MRGFARWKNLPLIEGVPRYGYVLDGGFGPVGSPGLSAGRRGLGYEKGEPVGAPLSQRVLGSA